MKELLDVLAEKPGQGRRSYDTSAFEESASSLKAQDPTLVGSTESRSFLNRWRQLHRETLDFILDEAHQCVEMVGVAFKDDVTLPRTMTNTVQPEGPI